MRNFEPRAFRKRRNLVLGRLSELVSPLLRAAARGVSRGARTNPSVWRNGLIISHNHIGDVLYRTCSLPKLRNALPHCRWTFLTTPESAEVLRGNPNIDEVLTHCTGDDSWNLTRRAFADLRTKNFDVALCTNTLRHYPDLLLAAALGIPNRVGFSYKGLSGLINHSVPITYPSPFPAYFRAMVAHVGNLAANWELRPQLQLNREHHDAAQRVWRESGITTERPVLALSITTRQAVSNWPATLLVEIIEAAARSTDFEVVVSGARDEADRVRTFASTLGLPHHVIAGELSIHEFAALLTRCAAMLTLDSGARHIANASAIPVFFLHNPAVSRVETGSYCSTETDLAPPVEFLSAGEVTRAAETFDVEGAAGVVADALKKSAG